MPGLSSCRRNVVWWLSALLVLALGGCGKSEEPVELEYRTAPSSQPPQNTQAEQPVAPAPAQPAPPPPAAPKQSEKPDMVLEQQRLLPDLGALLGDEERREKKKAKKAEPAPPPLKSRELTVTEPGLTGAKPKAKNGHPPASNGAPAANGDAPPREAPKTEAAPPAASKPVPKDGAPPAPPPPPAMVGAPAVGSGLAYLGRPAPSRSSEASWNTWFERGGKPAEVLQPDARYDLVLDLSMYRYMARLSAGAGPELRKKLEESRGLESLRFVVRPFSLDGKLRLAATEGALDAKLARLFGPAAEDEAERITRYQQGAITLAEFAHGVQAGEVRFGVVTLAKGCAAVALSVWDETGLFPLDQLVVSVPVAAANEPVPACGSEGAVRAVVEHGAGPLLQMSLERSPLEPAPRAALHLFETAVLGRPRTAVVMVERSAYERSKGSAGVYTWLTEALLSDYLARPEQLRVQIDEARRLASRNAANGYAAVARELATKLFSQEGGQENVASRAREALRRAVAESTDPVIVARMVTASGERAFMPLALLGARAENPVLARPMTVIEPLPVERYPGSRACIGNWTLAVPERLEGVGEAELSGAAQLAEGAARVKTEAELARYMSDSAPPAKPEGLVLLAHHSAGYLWFSDKTARVGREALSRRFAPGSVAVLSACTTASPEGDNLAWATKLNRQGVDAMVVSPFPVPADYAARLALEFGSAVRSARAANAAPTFLELFRKATRASADHFRAKYGAGVAYDELALEFVVAGDTSLRLCTNP